MSERQNRNILKIDNNIDYKLPSFKNHYINHENFMRSIYFDKSKLIELFQ